MACPVCFGDSNEPMALATNYGIWFMLGIVAAILTAFATFFIRLMRRARAYEATMAATTNPADAGRYARSQEGTA